MIHGEQGTGKSIVAKTVRKLIDPQQSPVLAAPAVFATWLSAQSTAGCWLMIISVRCATGSRTVCAGWQAEEDSRAGRFTDDERSVIHAERPVILNGIDEFVRRDDLADRCVFLHLPAIDAGSRRKEADLWQSFHADYPAILAGLLDAVAGGLRELPHVELAELPRMADFACFGEAVGRALGWPAGTFISAYNANRRDTTVTSLEESLVARLLLDNAALGGLVNWTLSATEMPRGPYQGAAAQGRSVGAMAQNTQGVHERATADCTAAPHARDLRQVHPNSGQPAHHDQQGSQVRLLHFAALHDG